jgi:hypothetical protein
MVTAAKDSYPNDADLLVAIRGMFEAIDPVPPDLPDRIRFSLAFRDSEAEMARFSCDGAELALAARGDEESRIVTFDSDSLTIMIRVDSNPDGTARVDGWLAPPQAHRVEMKMTERSITVTADERGRFVFLSVPRGTAQLVVRQLEAGAGAGAGAEAGATSERYDDQVRSAKSVITPALKLLTPE